MDNQEFARLFPINTEQQELAQKVLQSFQESQLIWLSGFLTGYVSGSQQQKEISNLSVSQVPSVKEPDTSNAAPQSALLSEKQITILYGTRTGNSRKAADLLHAKASAHGIKTVLADMNEYNPKNLKHETNLAVIVSTHGEGEPPLAAEEFYGFLHGNRAPKLENLQYSVLALGDKSYAQFCKTGADIDHKLAELGAKKLTHRRDCDIDFLPVADEWVNSVLENLGSSPENASQIHGSVIPTLNKGYSRTNPYQAEILEKIQLNGRGSGKETYHLEISLEGSGLKYQPGDALGIYPVNSDQVVNDLLSLTGLKGNERINLPSGQTDLHEALKNKLEIGTLSRDTLEKHNALLKNETLNEILTDHVKLSKFLGETDLLGLLRAYSYPYDAESLVTILRPLQPRLYSISSSIAAYPDEVHITAAALRYQLGDRNKSGTCSGFLADLTQPGDQLKVFIENNEGFRLPADPEVPIIMIGPGTGVAPFRSFVQHRAETGSKGRAWLFFGDQHFTTDFLYQSEWLDYRKKGILTNLTVAFSRDQKEKIYVQHRMKEHAEELMQWIEEGAYLYVCGDMKHMAKDVFQTLIEIVSLQKHITEEKAREYVQGLRKQRRYQEDVY